MRLPKSPEQKRADKAARQARWRKNKAIKDSIDAHIDHSVGLGPEPKRPMPTISSTDLATRIRDKTARYLDGVADAELSEKEVVAALKLGLTAQGLLDARARAQAKAGMQLELAAGLAAILSGVLPAPPPPQLDDPNVIEGDYEAI